MPDLDMLNQKVTEQFERIEDVELIYRVNEGTNITFYVFTSNFHYSDALMTRLIEREADLLRLFPHTSFSFRYVATLLAPDPRSVVGYGSQVIYARYGISLKLVRQIRDKLKEYFPADKITIRTFSDEGRKRLIICPITHLDPEQAFVQLKKFDHEYLLKLPHSDLRLIMVNLDFAVSEEQS